LRQPSQSTRSTQMQSKLTNTSNSLSAVNSSHSLSSFCWHSMEKRARIND
jgi:hypothetical protein